jgi:hypothetical protein
MSTTGPAGGRPAGPRVCRLLRAYPDDRTGVAGVDGTTAAGGSRWPVTLTVRLHGAGAAACDGTGGASVNGVRVTGADRIGLASLRRNGDRSDRCCGIASPPRPDPVLLAGEHRPGRPALPRTASSPDRRDPLPARHGLGDIAVPRGWGTPRGDDAPVQWRPRVGPVGRLDAAREDRLDLGDQLRVGPQLVEDCCTLTGHAALLRTARVGPAARALRNQALICFCSFCACVIEIFRGFASGATGIRRVRTPAS